MFRIELIIIRLLLSSDQFHTSVESVGCVQHYTFCVLKQTSSTSPLKPHVPPQPQNTDHDSGVDTFTRTMDHRSKHHHNNINAVPKAIPVR